MYDLSVAEHYQTEILNEIYKKIEGYCIMSSSDQLFLNGVIRQVRPKKILELGVSAGGSAAIILNAIKDIKGSKLHSIDYSKEYHHDETKLSGFIVNEKCPELADRWKLYTGGPAANFLDEIGDDIDLCLIDTMHRNPGELLDFLMVLPYLKKGAVVILHDVSLHVFAGAQYHTNCVLLSAINGQKFTPVNHDGYEHFANIGAVIMDENMQKRAWDIFNLLILPWEYGLSENDYNIILKHFEKHYDKKLTKLFTKAVSVNHQMLLKKNQENITTHEECIIQEQEFMKMKRMEKLTKV